MMNKGEHAVSVPLLSGPAPTERHHAPASPQRMDRGEPMSRHQPIPADLRVRAAFYRQRAKEAHNPTKVKEYLYIADVLDREADATKESNNNKQQRASA